MLSNSVDRYLRFTDERLVAACRAGDAQAWDALIGRYGALIRSIPRKLGLSHGDADDIFQDVCLQLFQHLDDLRDTQRLSSWLITTTRREVWRWSRRKQRAGVALPDTDLADSYLPADDAPGPDALAVAADELQRIRDAVEQLPEKCRSLLTALYLKEPPLAYHEVAERFGMPIGSIGPTRARCLARVLQALDGDA